MSFTRSFAVILLILWPSAAPADGPVTLPNTKPLTWEGDLSERMMDGLHRYIERKIAESVERRSEYWRRDFSSAEAYEQSIRPNRERLAKILGIVNPRVPVRMERFGDDENPALVARTDRYSVYQVRWPVLEGVFGEGLLLEPAAEPVGHAVAIPDADQTPEQITGLAPGVPNESQFARRLAENGFRVVVPAILDRSDEWSGNPRIAMTNQPHREWIYRQAFQMGRHVIGYEVEKVLAAVDWLLARTGDDAKVGVAGYAEGGLLASYAAAVDPRIDACLVSGYFDSRQTVWTEPIYRNVWGLLREFGDAEIATLVAPRGLVVEYSEVPLVTGPPPQREGRRGGGAAGELKTSPYSSVLDEFNRIDTLIPPGFQKKHLTSGPGEGPIGPGSQEAIEKFAGLLGIVSSMSISDEVPADGRKRFDPTERQRRQVSELENHVQWLVRDADHTRDQFFLAKAAPEYEKQRGRWITG
ncbi:MAG: dienelactone hydrolase family protein, partial [Planctomycetota bacterium]